MYSLVMSKIAGLGELIEGILERDPLDDSFQIRVLEGERQRVLRLQDVLAEYEGQDVRFTIASTSALSALAEAASGEATAVVTFDELAKGG